ncbi:uncharacterized protein M421DRAFT_123537 [Didymella exigua CBS 183.55]|uniref:Pre-mRNA-splicing factor n=1 Tax=Didymella exigua CBS 183.55 TaxID=1150837 RepID=A0A6A5RW90_9PLEO|nr:uncharacterized protein M421DRAFT_123537 [Didymella exigua CBS 183.55]KAF1929547.1 hypothetical protein M421DRAFT_123537 [Didymella exigua CBS 183.55]
MAAGGFKMSLGGLKTKPGLKGAGLKGGLKDPAKPKKALLGDDEPEDTNKVQEIAAFDAAQGGAIDVNGPPEKNGPLVIPSLPNRNWREEARKRQLQKAPHTKQSGEDVVMEEPEKEVVFGLTVPAKAEAQDSGAAEAETMDVDARGQDGEALTDAQRLEKAALEHLLNGKSTDTQRVVPAITDEQALANDLQDAPSEPDLDAYEATPIEGFGLAMLRGMGWKDSDGDSRTGTPAKAPKEVKRRPALLGIGAKEDAAKDVELGEFNSKARPKKGQKDAPAGYHPVTLRNKKTGEVITEEALKRKLESQDSVPDEARRHDDGDEPDRKRRRREAGDRERDTRRDYDSDRRRGDHDSDRRREKRRDRSRSPRSPAPRHRHRSQDAKDRRSRRDRSRSRSRDGERRRRRQRATETGQRSYEGEAVDS